MARRVRPTAVLDCPDAPQLSAFYGALLGSPITAQESDWVLLRDPNGGTGLTCQAEAVHQPPV